MKHVSTGVHALMLITVLVMQSAGAWYCLAKDSLCQVPALVGATSPHDCCGDGGDDSQPEEAPSCCVEIAPEPQNLAAEKKFQQPEPGQAELPDWAIPASDHPLSATGNSPDRLAGGAPPPAGAALTARLCVRRI